jgi:hypothetical protein
MCFIPTQSIAIEEDDNKPSSRISKRDKFTDQSEFNNSTFRKSGETGTKGLPPDPGDGDDGWPIPVGDGAGVVILGGLMYFLFKKRKKPTNSA